MAKALVTTCGSGLVVGMSVLPARATTRAKTFQRRRVASQTKPMQHCHPERELWISVRREIQSSRSELALERRDDIARWSLL